MHERQAGLWSDDVYLLEILELPLPVGVLDHALVLRHPPVRRHRDVVLERVDALVHQREVAVHLRPVEPSGASLHSGDAVQVALELVGRAVWVLRV